MSASFCSTGHRGSIICLMCEFLVHEQQFGVWLESLNVLPAEIFLGFGISSGLFAYSVCKEKVNALHLPFLASIVFSCDLVDKPGGNRVKRAVLSADSCRQCRQSCSVVVHYVSIFAVKC